MYFSKYCVYLASRSYTLLQQKLAFIAFKAQPEPSMPQQGNATCIGRASLGNFGKCCAQSFGSGTAIESIAGWFEQKLLDRKTCNSRKMGHPRKTVDSLLFTVQGTLLSIEAWAILTLCRNYKL